MSDGPKMSLPFARNLANHMLEILSPDCERIEIAGSIRRQKPEVSDIEIVLIPKPIHDLFGYPLFGAGRIEEALIRDGFELLKNGDHFKQARLPGGQVNFDIFLTTPEKFGVILTIRTGSADFSHWLVTSKQQGGALPSNMTVKDGRLVMMGSVPVATPEEQNFFDAIRLDWIPPEQRIEGRWNGVKHTLIENEETK